MKIERWFHYILVGLLAVGWACSNDDDDASNDDDDGPNNRHKQIYFGDTHVHTNYSADAFVLQIANNLSNDPNHACDYARACSAMDFYANTDHAESIWVSSQEGFGDKWRNTVEAVESCNEAAAASTPEGEDPDLAVFNGFEWTGGLGDVRWGHKNIIFRGEAVPQRPIGANLNSEQNRLPAAQMVLLVDRIRQLAPTTMPDATPEEMEDFFERLESAWGDVVTGSFLPACEPDAEPDDESCIHIAKEPRELWRRLNAYYGQPEYEEKGYDVLAIPHGTAWALIDNNADLDAALNPLQHDSNIERLVEIFSGHGNSEEYRDFEAPDSDFISCVNRAIEIVRERCLPADCEADVQAVLDGGTLFASQGTYNTGGTLIDPEKYPTTLEDWGHCGECTDCFMPSELYFPKGSVQYGMARTGFDENGEAESRLRWGIVASTDLHMGEPGAVEETRLHMDVTPQQWMRDDPLENELLPFKLGRDTVEAERVASFWFPGGLAAVHAESRTRDDIFDAMKRRETYGTTGPRIMLWFDAELGQREVPMGGALEATESPTFTVEAWGALETLPGCPQSAIDRWGQETIDALCRDACYNPGDQRIGIERIEVVKVTPQINANEKVGDLIEDPWRVFENEEKSAQFTVEFDDPDYAHGGRDAIYYVRALQVPTPAINGRPLEDKNGDFRVCNLSDPEGLEPCTVEINERAWSSPIWVDYVGN